MTKRKLGVRIETVDLTEGPYLEESLRSTKWRKKRKRAKMPQPRVEPSADPSAASWKDNPVDDYYTLPHEDPPIVKDRVEKLPVRSKVHFTNYLHDSFGD